MEKKHDWKTKGFKAFRQGTFGNGGQNIYVSRKGILQRIHRTSVKNDGYVDLVFCNSQAHEELVPMAIYPDPLRHPDEVHFIHMGAAADAVVADMTGKGTEDMVWGCRWDGMNWHHNSAIYYTSPEEGPSEKYVNYLPSPCTKAVAAGDFNGDGLNDLAFAAADEIRIFTQGKRGFSGSQMVTMPIKNITSMAAFKFPGDKVATLFLQKKDGSVTTLKEYTSETKESPLLPADPSFQETKKGFDTYAQFVEEPAPKLRVILINKKPHLAHFLQDFLELYPLTANGLETPLIIHCPKGVAVVSGDVFHRGETDLLIASRDRKGKEEFSYLYLGNKGKFSEKKRLSIPTFRASDAEIGNFSGGPGLDLVISQSHTYETYDNDILIFPTGTLTIPTIPEPRRILGHNVFKSLVVHDKTGKSYLVVGNFYSGSFIGNPDNYIYLGGPDGYHPHNRLSLPGWGSVDMVCCDLNDNGRPDLVFANASELAPWLDYGSYIYLQDEKGNYGRKPQRLKTTRAHGVVVGDLNHNGYLDLIFDGFDNSRLKIFHGGPNGYSEENSREIEMVENGKIYKQPRFLSLADLNGDGYLDLIVTIIDSDEAFVLWGGPNGFSFQNRQTFNVHHCVNSKVADLNGDGYPELLFAGHSPSFGKCPDAFLYIYWGGPDGYSETRRTLLPSNAINSLNIADFNNDGLLDIFIASYQNSTERDIPSYIYWNSPEGFSAYNRTPLATHAVSGSLAADLNDDGYVDLAVGNHKVNSQHIAYSTVWYNGKNGFSKEHTINLPSKGIHGMGNVDPGNILDRSFNEYYESPIHEIPVGYGISQIHWEAEIPHKCAVYAQFRVADSKKELASKPWMGPINADSHFDAYDRVEKERFNGKFMQYRLILYAFNAVSSPRIKSVTVEFEPYPTTWR